MSGGSGGHGRSGGSAGAQKPGRAVQSDAASRAGGGGVRDGGPQTVPPIRSLLFVPANREDRIRKALAGDADGIAIDLESATPQGESELARAREIVGRVLREASAPGSGPAILVRVHEAGSPDQARDLEAIVGASLAAILLPQVVTPDDVASTDAALTRAEQAAGLAPGRIRIMPLVESANAVRQAYEIASASPRVAYMGGATSRGGDLARSLGYRFTDAGLETLFLRSKVLVDVRAAGVPNPISGLWGRVDDLEGLRAFAQHSRDLGYEGLLTIHPAQVPIVNAIFSPSAAELAEWRRIIAAMEDAEREGLGAIRLDGRLVDAAHAKTARQQLERARRLGIE
ncbi:MAG: CoA ester lyase [Myxococcota bacterium]